MELFSAALGVAGGAAAAQAVAQLREHRTEPTGLADLLGWGFLVGDGVVLQKDGSLLAGFAYSGPDVSAATAAELDALTQHVNDAFLPFADDWMLHIDAIRRPAVAYPAGVFPDAVSRLIDDERRAAYRVTEQGQFETSYALVITHLPPAELYSRLATWFVRGGNRTGVDWDRVLAAFEAAVTGLEHRLAARLRLHRLDSDALVTHLHECLTGEPHGVRAPAHGAYLNVVLADQELIGGFEPRIGRNHVRAVAVHGYPEASHAGGLDTLNALPYAFRWSSRIVPLAQPTAARLIRRYQLSWYKKRKGAAAWLQDLVGSGAKRDHGSDADADLFIDHDARRMVQDASAAVAENASGTVRFCFFNQVLVINDPDADRADAVAAELLKTLHDAGYTGRIEGVNALEAYLGTLPGHGYPNLRRPLVSTRNIADLLPITGVWPGLAVNPSPLFPPRSPPLLWAATAGATPFRVNLHDSDVGHALVLGKTGAGKSTLLGLVAAQFRRYAAAQVFVFDVGYSMWLLAHAVGGAHYDLAAGRTDVLRFQPLAQIDDPAERAWAADWLETLMTVQGIAVTPVHRARIDHALLLLAGNAPPHRTLTELTAQLQHPELLSGLRPYTMAGHYGQLLDATEDDLTDSQFTVFEMKHLLALDDRIAIPVLLYLFRRIEQRLDGRPTLIEIDEAWMALLHPRFGPRITQWLLTLRKQNAAVVLATQSPAQLAQMATRHAVIDSCPTKFYLPNADAAAPGAAELYRDLGLNGREIGTISGATPKRHYYMKTPRGSRLVELGLGQLALALLAPPTGLTIEDAKRRVESLMRERGAAWLPAWLDECGLGAAASALREERGHAALDEVDTLLRTADTETALTDGGRANHERHEPGQTQLRPGSARATCSA
jgi:type IV secretion system protein VirB4